MGNTFKTGNYVNGIFQDTSNNIGIGAAPSGTYKFEITGTSKVSGVLTLGATLSNGTYTYTLPAATGTLALTSDIPVVTGFVPYTGATADVNLGIYTLTASGVDSVGYTARGSGTLSGYLIIKQGTTYLGNVVGYNSINANARKYVFISDVDGTNYKSAIFELSSLTNNTDRTYTLPDASGTIALVGGSGVGTVTSVAALTIGTSGTDLSSTVANSTTTPVITLNVPTASAANRGALSSADWTTFNGKQGTITLTTTGTSGAATFSANTLNIPNYGSALSGYLPLTGGTLTGALGGTSAVFSSSVDAGGDITATNTQNGTSTIRLNNTNSGSSANARLLLVSDSGNAQIKAVSSTNVTYVVGDAMVLNADTMSGGMLFAHNDSVKMSLSASGNLGLGVTPSAWGSGSTAFQIGNGAIWKSGSRSVDWIANGYYDGTNYIYNLTNAATFYRQYDGQHQWYQAPSGTAGNAITFTQAMTLFNDGNLLLTNSTVSNAGYKLDVNGTGRFSGSGANSAVSLTVNGANSESTIAKFARGGSEKPFYISASNNAYVNLATEGAFKFKVNVTTDLPYSSGTDALILASTGAATFSSSVSVNTTNAVSTFEIGAAESDGTGSTNAVRIQSKTGASNQQLIIGINQTGSYSFLQSSQASVGYKNLALNPNGGNVGIGTSSPQLKFVVSNGGAAGFEVNPVGSGSGVDILSYNRSTSAYTQLTIDGSLLAFNTSATERMRITSGGNVLIGTTTDDTINKLQVSGGIYSSNYNTNFNSVTINSSTNVNTAVLDIGIVCFRDAVNGGGCLVFYENGQTPVIVSQSGGTTFTTSSPSATEIQISNRSGSRGLQALGGSSRNSVQLIWSVFRITGLSA